VIIHTAEVSFTETSGSAVSSDTENFSDSDTDIKSQTNKTVENNQKPQTHTYTEFSEPTKTPVKKVDNEIYEYSIDPNDKTKINEEKKLEKKNSKTIGENVYEYSIDANSTTTDQKIQEKKIENSYEFSHNPQKPLENLYEFSK